MRSPAGGAGDGQARHTASYSYTPDVARALVTLGLAADASGEVWHLPVAETRTTRDRRTRLRARRRARLMATGKTTFACSASSSRRCASSSTRSTSSPSRGSSTTRSSGPRSVTCPRRSTTGLRPPSSGTAACLAPRDRRVPQGPGPLARAGRPAERDRARARRRLPHRDGRADAGVRSVRRHDPDGVRRPRALDHRSTPRSSRRSPRCGCRSPASSTRI